MLVAFTTGTLAFWFDLPVFVWASAGLLVRRRDHRRRAVQARLRGQGAEVRAQGPLVECSTNSSPGPSPTPRSGALRAASQQVEADALARPPALDALAALAPADRVKIIAEVKRASPSRGALAEIADPAALAVSYQTGGASRDQRPHRGTPLRRLARRPRAGARRGRDPGAAQGLHRRGVPGVRGARRRRRPRAAHRRRARAAGAAAPARAHRRARHDGAGRDALGRRGRARPRSRRPRRRA